MTTVQRNACGRLPVHVLMQTIACFRRDSTCSRRWPRAGCAKTPRAALAASWPRQARPNRDLRERYRSHYVKVSILAPMTQGNFKKNTTYTNCICQLQLPRKGMGLRMEMIASKLCLLPLALAT